jgi:two-component system LytT family sensor kinase
LVTSVCVALKCALMVMLFRMFGGPSDSFARVAAQSFLFDLIVLWGIIAVIQALELHVQSVQREQTALALRAQLADAELQILKGQLQPHFLFNTLNGVASLIHTAPAAADFVVVQLADLLRASLDFDGAREIPLSAELALLDKYLAIMKARFEGRLAIHQEVDEPARCALVPQFLLQPLVENAFEHGIGRRAGAGCITIRASIVQPARLRLEVRDDGAGVAGGGVREGGGGVGLSNTRRRLERLYGEAYSPLLNLSSLPGGGAMVAVEIPFRAV